MKITTEAKAKINLYLDVLCKRSDGYHDICSIMHTVSLCDTLTIDTDVSNISLTCSDPLIPTDSKNLAWKAAELFFHKTGICGGARIHIEKAIPSPAGLAGGSSDAAAVLRALNEAFGHPLSLDELCAVGALIGADIPFCVKGGCALCTGRGEVMKELLPLTGIPCVVAKGGDGVSTPLAYKKLDELYGSEIDRSHGNISAAMDALKSGDLHGLYGAAFNIFEAAVLPDHPTARYIKDTMYELGADLAMMSGSGPSVFAFFPCVSASQAAAEALRQQGIAAFVCTT